MNATDKPKVTVLLPTYNRPQYLEEAIQTVVNQRFTDWELIVLNDGGVDVRHVVDKFADPRIIYVTDAENKGAARRLNQGLALARGEYVAHLDDDDHFYPNHLEVLAKALDEHPEVALVYSDLYAVSSVADPETGRRYIVDKRISVSRSFNREFMFHYNHVLHVSFMHRLEAARRVGGYDESVKVLIEWSLNRRMAFLYDFYHVEEATGEYFMPVFKSDRISVRERRNTDSYKHNLRRIRCSHPAEPWDKVERIDLLYLVTEWGEKLNGHLRQIIDSFDHPFKTVLINNGAGLTVDQAKASLGELAELKSLSIHHLSEKETPVEAFRKAAKRSSAKYLLLVTPALQAEAHPKRLFATLDAFNQHPEIKAIRWEIPEEQHTPFDCLILREYFLERSKPGSSNSLDFQAISIRLAKGFKFDAMFADFKKARTDKRYADARRIMNLILQERTGFPHIQYLVHYMAPVWLAQKDYASLEEVLRGLIARGYSSDNLIRLGVLMNRQGRHAEAIETLRRALADHGLTEESFEAKCFPAQIPREMSVFHLVYAMGDSYLELGDVNRAARCYHLAARLMSEGHKPLLGFARVYMQAGQLDRAEAALHRLPGTNSVNDPETHRLLAKLCQRRRNLPLAFDCLKKAFEVAPDDELNVDPFYFVGAALARWPEMGEPLARFVEKFPEHGNAWARLASVYFNQGDRSLAVAAAERCLLVDPKNPVARSIIERLKGQEPAMENMGGLQLTGGLNLDLADTPISW